MWAGVIWLTTWLSHLLGDSGWVCHGHTWLGAGGVQLMTVRLHSLITLMIAFIATVEVHHDPRLHEGIL